MLPSEAVLHDFDHPDKAGIFASDTPGLCEHYQSDASLALRLQVIVLTTNIEDARFQALGPSSLIACAARTAQSLCGSDREILQQFSGQSLIDALQLHQSARYLAFFVEDAVRALGVVIERQVCPQI